MLQTPSAAAGDRGLRLPVSTQIVGLPFLSGGWFSGQVDSNSLRSAGFRLIPGGTHLSRTMMLAELRHVLEVDSQPTSERLRSLVLDDNVLQRRTGSARRLSLRHLRELYGLGATPPISRAMVRLWPKAGEGQPMLALLAALAREVLLRKSAEIILAVPAGAPVRAADIDLGDPVGLQRADLLDQGLRVCGRQRLRA